MTTTRGVRNCNPANIRKGAQWLGMHPIQDDASFVRFKCMHYGIRALIKILHTYVVKHHLFTIREIVNRFAPPSENATSNYIDVVSASIGISPDEQLLSVIDFEVGKHFDLFCICKAICFVESGYRLDEYVFTRALSEI